MAAIFWRQLATHEKYFAVAYKCRDPYFHHSLRKNVVATDHFNGKMYPIRTNSLGFKDASRREVPLQPEGARFVFLGDSFTEGIYLPYESTFVGMIANELKRDGIDVLNAGVATYSPKLYFYKTKYLIEKVRLKFDRLYLFIDMSDIEDEIVYRSYTPDPDPKDDTIRYYLRMYAIKYSVIGNLFDRFIQKYWPDTPEPADQVRFKIIGEHGNVAAWKFNISGWYEDKNYSRWGAEGFALAEGYMNKLLTLCKNNNIEVTIAVYPWPRQVDEGLAENGHVRSWKKYADRHGVNFINFYPPFMSANPGQVIEKYYLEDDIHFNEAGNRVISDAFLTWLRSSGE